DQELVMARFVSAESQARAVVALDINLRPPERLREPRGMFEGRGEMRQRKARQAGDRRAEVGSRQGLSGGRWHVGISLLQNPDIPEMDRIPMILNADRAGFGFVGYS